MASADPPLAALTNRSAKIYSRACRGWIHVTQCRSRIRLRMLFFGTRSTVMLIKTSLGIVFTSSSAVMWVMPGIVIPYPCNKSAPVDYVARHEEHDIG